MSSSSADSKNITPESVVIPVKSPKEINSETIKTITQKQIKQIQTKIKSSF
jgi:hypothetical protein